MNSTAPAIVDHAVQDMHRWLKFLVEKYHLRDQSQAYSGLRAVLHVLRDRLTPEQALHLGAQLPTLIRGIYFEGWKLSGKPTDERTIEQFCGRVTEELPPAFPRDALSLTKAVFDLLWQEIDPGATAKLIDGLPVPLRVLWPAEAAR